MTEPNTMDLHRVTLPENYIPSPGSHLTNTRDCEHYLYSLENAMEINADTILDVGSYDGWHALLLALDGYNVTAVEFIHELIQATQRYIDVTKSASVSLIEADWLSAKLPNTRYDMITIYEVLEHVPMSEVPKWVDKADYYGKRILVSLPDQSHELNPQHQWTPTKELILQLFGSKKNFKIEYSTYPLNKTIPNNWLVSYDT